MTFEERLAPKRVNELRERLAHVLWIGGSPSSGKSSIAELLSQRLNYQVYHCDKAFTIHTQNLVPDRHPTFHKVTRMSWDEIWTDRDVTFGRWVIERTIELNLHHLVINGGRSILKNVAIVQEHFRLM